MSKDTNLNLDRVHLQWFGEGEGTGEGEGGEPLKAEGTFLAQAPDKYKADQKYLKDLLPVKNWGGVLDRMYASEQKLAETQGRLPVVPEKIEEYELEKPQLPEDLEYDPEVEKAFREHAKTVGMTKAQAKEGYNWFNKLIVDQYNTALAETKKEKEEAFTKLKTTWGVDFPKKYELMRRAVATLVGAEFLKRLETIKGPDGIALGNDPALIEGFYNIGTKIGEENLQVVGEPGAGAEGGNTEFLKDLYPSMKDYPDRNVF